MLTGKPEIWSIMSHIFGTSNGKSIDHMSSTDAIQGDNLIVPKLDADTNELRIGLGNLFNDIDVTCRVDRIGKTTQVVNFVSKMRF